MYEPPVLGERSRVPLTTTKSEFAMSLTVVVTDASRDALQPIVVPPPEYAPENDVWLAASVPSL